MQSYESGLWLWEGKPPPVLPPELPAPPQPVKARWGWLGGVALAVVMVLYPVPLYDIEAPVEVKASLPAREPVAAPSEPPHSEPPQRKPRAVKKERSPFEIRGVLTPPQ